MYCKCESGRRKTEDQSENCCFQINQCVCEVYSSDSSPRIQMSLNKSNSERELSSDNHNETGLSTKRKWIRLVKASLKIFNESNTNYFPKSSEVSSSFRNRNCLFRNYSYQVNFQHSGQISRFLLQKYHSGDKTHKSQDCTWHFSQAFQWMLTYLIT